MHIVRQSAVLTLLLTVAIGCGGQTPTSGTAQGFAVVSDQGVTEGTVTRSFLDFARRLTDAHNKNQFKPVRYALTFKPSGSTGTLDVDAAVDAGSYSICHLTIGKTTYTLMPHVTEYELRIGPSGKDKATGFSIPMNWSAEKAALVGQNMTAYSSADRALAGQLLLAVTIMIAGDTWGLEN